MRTEGRLSERITPALEPPSQPVDGPPVAIRESSPLCLSATSLEGWSGIQMAATNTAISIGRAANETEGVDTLKVRDARDVEQAVRAAIPTAQPLKIIAHASNRPTPPP